MVERFVQNRGGTAFFEPANPVVDPFALVHLGTSGF